MDILYSIDSYIVYFLRRLRMKNFIGKYKEIILYLFFGVLTTLINIIVYFILTRIMNLSTIYSTVIAFILSVIFAYITNKIWVFNSKTETLKEIGKEIVAFFGGRLFSGGCDILIMYVFVDVLGCNDLIIKILSNVMVVIMNYIISKLFVFKGGNGESEQKK